MPEFDELLVRSGHTFAKLFVRIWRAKTPRATVFCIHGFEGNGSDFDFLATRLLEQDLTVVCPDMIGRGKSAFFGDASKYDLGLYLNCLAAVSKFAGNRNHFIGTSWGGTILIALLSSTPVKADRLILNDVILRGGLAADDLHGRIRLESSLTFERLADARAYVRHTRSFLGHLSEEAWDNFVRNRLREENGVYRMAYDPFAVSDTRQERIDRVPLVRRIKSELLLMYGAKSPFLDREAIDAVQKDRDHAVSFACVDGAGHPPSLMTAPQADIVAAFLA
jgi:pimeloyl-ACP methyl ester carboxylesterase